MTELMIYVNQNSLGQISPVKIAQRNISYER